MGSALTSILLPAALAIVMFGLGLSLTVDDFHRVRKQPRAVVVALVCQLLVLPLVCFGLVKVFNLSPVLAVGMMILAASPGGTTANLFSHLFRGDVALNISLTAVNSVLAAITLPVVANFSLGHFQPALGDGGVGLQFGKVLQVFAIVLVPVLIGMVVRSRASAFAARMDRPVRILSIAVLVMVILGTMVAERENIATYIADAGLVALAFCVASLSVGYVVPRMFKVDQRQAVACAMEIGIHNGTLAIAIAISVLGSVSLAVPAAVYSLVMYPCATVAGLLITRAGRRVRQAEAL